MVWFVMLRNISDGIWRYGVVLIVVVVVVVVAVIIGDVVCSSSPPDNTLSVSQISSPGGAACTFFGVDGSDTFLFGAQSVQVGPPQAQVSGVCDGD